jgi:hypothetical protein
MIIVAGVVRVGAEAGARPPSKLLKVQKRRRHDFDVVLLLR